MTLHDHLESAMGEARLENARRINNVRMVATGAFVLTMWAAVYVFGDGTHSRTLLPTIIYFSVAVVLVVGSRFSRGMLSASRFAIPFFDMPVVFTIQLMNVQGNSDPGMVSEFSIAIFICLLMLSTHTLNFRHILFSTGLAIVLQQILQSAAEVDLGRRILSPVIFGVAAWICLDAGRTLSGLLERVTMANARRLRLQRYFSPGVGEILEGRDEDSLALGQDCELTFIFIDIRGFTSLSEKLTGPEVVELLNTYHGHMVEVVFQHGGTLDKYLGDGLMAYFNAPVGQPDHASRAVHCALAMQRELVALNEQLTSAGKAPLEMGAGVHTGHAVVGDIGAPNRREFTVIGNAVNVTSRLEGMTKETGQSIVVSEQTAKLVPEILWKELGSFPIRGCEEPMSLFSPLGNDKNIGTTA